MEDRIKGAFVPRNPRASPLYQLVEDHYEAFEGCYDDRYQEKYGFWRPVIKNVFLRYLDCGCLHGGFARVRCEDCGDEYLLPYSCKCRCFCPSCSQRRAIELGESLTGEIIDAHVPIRNSTFTIPKMLRIYFRFDHKLYPKLCQCAFETVRELFQAALGREDVVPGMVIGIHTWGNFVNSHPHLHGMLCQGCYDKEGNFHQLPDAFDEKKCEKLFMHKVFKMLLEEDKINESIIENLMSWHNSGFNVHFSDVLYPQDRENREKAARYLVRAPISLSKMTYKADEGKVIYGNPGAEKRVYEALDFLALLSSHIPDKFENRILYYGYWSKKSRGLRKKMAEELSGQEFTIVKPLISSKSCRRRWAALIRKVWHADPLKCRKCGGLMKIVSFIDDFPVIKRILTHLNLWHIPHERPPPRSSAYPDEGYLQKTNPYADYYFLDVALGRN